MMQEKYHKELLHDHFGSVTLMLELTTVRNTTLTTASGSVNLPTDFSSIRRVFKSDGTELSKVSAEMAVGNTGDYFYIGGDFFSGYTLNVLTGIDDTFTVFYLFRPEEIASDSDICKIPDYEAPVFYAYSRLRDSETDPIEDSDKYMDMCEKRIKKMRSEKEENETYVQFKLQAGA